MTTFDTAFHDTKRVVSSWTNISKFQAITIVRDVKGHISLYLEPTSGQTLTKADVDTLTIDLRSILATSLDPLFSGQIYIKTEAEEWLKDLFVLICSLRIADAANATPLHWFTINRGIAKKAWINQGQHENPVWDYNDTQLPEAPAPGVVTFYSYKGGMGRTTALVATALELIRQGKNVLMIDTDLEAPGLSTFFFAEDDPIGAIEKGTVDYLLEKHIDSSVSPDMTKYIVSLTSPNYCPEGAGNLYLVCSGKLDDAFLPKLARIDSQELIEGRLKKNLDQLLIDCRSVLERNGGVDYILIDSRAGFHDMAGVVTAQIPHGVVLFGKDSFQSWYGIRQAVHTISESQADKPAIMLVDSGCGKDEIVSAEEKESFLSHSYTIFTDCYYSSGEEQPSLYAENEAHSPIYVPYSSLLAGDIPLYDTNRAEILQAKLAEPPYKAIAQRLIGWFGNRPGEEGGVSDHGQERTS